MRLHGFVRHAATPQKHLAWHEPFIIHSRFMSYKAFHDLQIPSTSQSQFRGPLYNAKHHHLVLPQRSPTAYNLYNVHEHQRQSSSGVQLT